MPRAWVVHRHVADTLFVQEPAQLQVDLAGRELARVEDRALAIDPGDPRDSVVELDQPARVKPWLLRYRFHTIT
jgi:hypothetical protein